MHFLSPPCPAHFITLYHYCKIFSFTGSHMPQTCRPGRRPSHAAQSIRTLVAMTSCPAEHCAASPALTQTLPPSITQKYQQSLLSDTASVTDLHVYVLQTLYCEVCWTHWLRYRAYIVSSLYIFTMSSFCKVWQCSIWTSRKEWVILHRHWIKNLELYIQTPISTPNINFHLIFFTYVQNYSTFWK
jgi:hypothetical protein